MIEWLKSGLQNPADAHFILAFVFAFICILLLAFTNTRIFSEFMYYFPENIVNYIGWHIRKAKKILNKIARWFSK